MAKRGTHRAVAAWIFGALTLIFLMVVFFMSGKEASPLQHRIAGLIGATMAAFFGFFFIGSMKIATEGKLPKWGKVSIQAGSGMALFVFVLLWWGSDAAPLAIENANSQPVPPGATINFILFGGGLSPIWGGILALILLELARRRSSDGFTGNAPHQEIGNVKASGGSTVNITQHQDVGHKGTADDAGE